MAPGSSFRAPLPFLGQSKTGANLVNLCPIFRGKSHSYYHCGSIGRLVSDCPDLRKTFALIHRHVKPPHSSINTVRFCVEIGFRIVEVVGIQPCHTPPAKGHGVSDRVGLVAVEEAHAQAVVFLPQGRVTSHQVYRPAGHTRAWPSYSRRTGSFWVNKTPEFHALQLVRHITNGVV